MRTPHLKAAAPLVPISVLRWAWRLPHTMTTPTLAIDPGSQDGAAYLDIDGPAAWWTWTWLKGKGGRYRVRTSEGRVMDEDTLHGVANLIALALCPGGFHLVVEGLYTPPRRSKKAASQAQGVIVLAESAGMIMGPLLDMTPVTVSRPPATTWRSEVLHLPGGMDDKRAEEYAVNYAARQGFKPTHAAGLTYAEEGATCEAYCMAQFRLQGVTA